MLNMFIKSNSYDRIIPTKSFNHRRIKLSSYSHSFKVKVPIKIYWFIIKE